MSASNGTTPNGDGQNSPPQILVNGHQENLVNGHQEERMDLAEEMSDEERQEYRSARAVSGIGMGPRHKVRSILNLDNNNNRADVDPGNCPGCNRLLDEVEDTLEPGAVRIENAKFPICDMCAETMPNLTGHCICFDPTIGYCARCRTRWEEMLMDVAGERRIDYYVVGGDDDKCATCDLPLSRDVADENTRIASGTWCLLCMGVDSSGPPDPPMFDTEGYEIESSSDEHLPNGTSAHEDNGDLPNGTSAHEEGDGDLPNGTSAIEEDDEAGVAI